jgi:hypothetical protein
MSIEDDEIAGKRFEEPEKNDDAMAKGYAA